MCVCTLYCISRRQDSSEGLSPPRTKRRSITARKPCRYGVWLGEVELSDGWNGVRRLTSPWVVKAVNLPSSSARRDSRPQTESPHISHADAHNIPHQEHDISLPQNPSSQPHPHQVPDGAKSYVYSTHPQHPVVPQSKQATFSYHRTSIMSHVRVSLPLTD